MSFTLPSRDTTTAAFLRRYGSAGQVWAEELYGRAYNWALDQADLRESSVDIDLVADQREYDLSATLLRASSVEYWSDEDEYRKLRSVTLSELDQKFDGWRLEEGEPEHYYIASVAGAGNLAKTVIGFREKPQTATSAGYPIVTVRGQFIDQLGDSDMLPAILRDDAAILDKMYALYAKEKDPKNFALYNAIADETAREMVRRVNRTQKESKPMIIAGARFTPRRRR
jgi:hypothetical protein